MIGFIDLVALNIIKKSYFLEIPFLNKSFIYYGVKCIYIKVSRLSSVQNSSDRGAKTDSIGANPNGLNISAFYSNSNV